MTTVNHNMTSQRSRSQLVVLLHFGDGGTRSCHPYPADLRHRSSHHTHVPTNCGTRVFVCKRHALPLRHTSSVSIPAAQRHDTAPRPETATRSRAYPSGISSLECDRMSGDRGSLVGRKVGGWRHGDPAKSGKIPDGRDDVLLGKWWGSSLLPEPHLLEHLELGRCPMELLAQRARCEVHAGSQLSLGTVESGEQVSHPTDRLLVRSQADPVAGASICKGRTRTDGEHATSLGFR